MIASGLRSATQTDPSQTNSAAPSVIRERRRSARDLNMHTLLVLRQTGPQRPTYPISDFCRVESPGIKHGGSEQALRLQTGERQAIAAADACLFEDVPEVDFYGAGANAERVADVLVFHATLDQLHDLQLARSQRGAGQPGGPVFGKEDTGLDPGFAGADGAKAFQERFDRNGLANHAMGAGLQKTQRLSLGYGDSPYDGSGRGMLLTEGFEAIHDGINAKNLVNQ